MTLPTIEHGFPIPRADGRGIYNRALKSSPWARLLFAMQYGDSVRVPLREYRLIRQAARHQCIRVVTKRLSKTEWRIWRVRDV